MEDIYWRLYQGLSKHQKAGFNHVTKVFSMSLGPTSCDEKVNPEIYALFGS